MKPEKKNNFWTFIFAFVPGASEMYMGYMKSGLSLLIAFAFAVAIPAAMYGGDVFYVIPIIIYIYSFFHARNLAKASDEAFEAFEDKPFWEELTGGDKISIPAKTLRKWLAVILIVFGVSSIWGMLSKLVFSYEIWGFILSSEEYWVLQRAIDSVPSFVVAIIAIVIGAKLIAGKKKEVEKDGRESDN